MHDDTHDDTHDDMHGVMNNGMSGDPWATVSHDVISRFLDVLLTEHAFARKTRIAYGVDLHKLDGWMQRTRQRSAIAANMGDLHHYFAEHLPESCSLWTVKRARNSARRFYNFLRDSHYRDDNPMARAKAVRPRVASSLAASGLEVAA